MRKLNVGIIGCGGRGDGHALGYSLSDAVKLTACSDIHEPASRRLAEAYGIERTYTDYVEMLRQEDLDIVSMCLWPERHAEAVLACLETPTPPRLINAEKPMAPTYGECVRMHEACRDAGVMLTFSHQRRFGPHFSKARDLIAAGAIGTLQRLEMDCSNLLDWGTHWFDMMQFYNDDLEPDWVMGQIACVADSLVFGARIETAGIAYIKWPNQVTGILTTGHGTGAPTPIRIVGSEGMIDVDHGKTRMLAAGRSWEPVEVEPMHVPGGDTSLHILDSIECALTGRESILCSANALRATQLIFATYESARRRARVLLPLKTSDSALLTMLDKGEMRIPQWPAFLTSEEEEAGFRLLFNGTDLSGWQSVPAAAWEAQGGILRGGVGALGRLLALAPLPNATVRFEFRLSARAEAALILRADDAGNGWEIPLKEDRWGPRTVDSTGGLAGHVAPKGDPNTGGSRWNWLEATLNGDDLTVRINDVTLLECDVAAVPGMPAGGGGGLQLRLDRGRIDVRNVLARPLA